MLARTEFEFGEQIEFDFGHFETLDLALVRLILSRRNFEISWCPGKTLPGKGHLKRFFFVECLQTL